MHLKPIFDNGALAFCQNCYLPPDIAQPPDHLLVPLNETIQSIGYIHLITEFLNKLLSPSKVVTRHPRKQMMDCLELQTSVEEIEPLRTVDVHGCP